MPADPQWDVLIRGGGIAGATAALLLARRGRSVLVLEKSRSPQHRVCGEFLSPEALPLLARLGVRETFAAAGAVPVDTAAIFGGSGRPVRIPLPAPGLGLSRLRLDTLLLAAAESAGATVRRGALVTRFEAEPDEGYAAVGVRGEVLARGETAIDAAGKHAVAAESRTSAGRRLWSAAVSAALAPAPAPGPSFECRGAAAKDKAVETTALQSASHRTCRGFVGVKAHFRGACSAPGTVALHSFHDGYCGTAPVEEGLLNVCLVATETTLRRAGSPDALFAAVLAACPPLAEQLAGAERVQPAFVCTAGLRYRAAAPPLSPIPRLGDTAGLIAPLTGDGIAMALRGAELAAPLVEACLTGELPAEALGAACRAALVREFAARRGWGRALHELLTRPAAVAVAARVLARTPAAGQFLFARTRGVVG